MAEKQTYNYMEIEVIVFDAEDLIVTSSQNKTALPNMIIEDSEFDTQ